MIVLAGHLASDGQREASSGSELLDVTQCWECIGLKSSRSCLLMRINVHQSCGDVEGGREQLLEGGRGGGGGGGGVGGYINRIILKDI